MNRTRLAGQDKAMLSGLIVGLVLGLLIGSKSFGIVPLVLIAACVVGVAYLALRTTRSARAVAGVRDERVRVESP